jgi:proline dehydrogenase
MLRSFFIYLSKAAWAQNLVMNWGFAWRAASRFVSGTKVDDAIRAIRELNAKGIRVTLDHLGENTSRPEEASEATAAIIDALNEIQKTGVCANVSVKLTQMGLGLDEGLCAQNLERVLARAKEHGNFVRIDMEDTPYTDKTIGMFCQMRDKGYRNTGIVLQSMLYRTEADARKLLADFTPIRLVKGAYNEPADKAYPKKADVDANYDLIVKLMMDTALLPNAPKASPDGCWPPIPAVATHDERRIEFARKYAEKIGLPKDGFEFQMLYGIRRDLQDQLVKQGYQVRVYVPYGTHWYPYFMRRLAERPANVWFFISNYFRN